MVFTRSSALREQQLTSFHYILREVLFHYRGQNSGAIRKVFVVVVQDILGSNKY